MQDSSRHKPGPSIGIVIIGRNEGERLIACLESLKETGAQIVYVDSGSTDGSVEAAKSRGADIVSLDMTKPFTAARARNAGYAKLTAESAPEFVQFIDGDCTLAPGWLDAATRYLLANTRYAVACGRRRETRPDQTIFNRLVDREWETPVGDALACGGDALMRCAAFDGVGGFSDELIAGEEPELCIRLRAAGWKIRRLDEEMTGHDIAMTTLGQWLKRARRAGHAFAEVSHRHRGTPEAIWAKETLRALFWTGLFAAILIAGAFNHYLWLGLFVFPLQIARMAMRDGAGEANNWRAAALLMLQKPWEAAGVIQYWMSKIFGARRTLIEYKK